MVELLAAIWIGCWFAAIWIYPTKLFLSGLFALVLGLIASNAEKNS